MSDMDNDRSDLRPFPGGLRPGIGGPEPDVDLDEAPRRRGLTSAIVVLLGLGVFAGIIWYAYSQGTRAGSETVAPILRAETGPTKVRPEQPGGLQVPHQDKLVYDRLNPGAATEPGVERLLPPPELPLERPKAPEPLVPAGPGPDTGDDRSAPVQAAEASRAPAAEAAPAPAAPSPAQPQALQPSPQPQPRSQSETQKAATAQPPATEAPQPANPPAVTDKPAQTAQAPATGGVRLQIAAVDSESKAAAEWGRLQRRFPAELGGLGVRYVRADLGARGVFFRIQAGPVEESRAREICAALKAQNVGCITVRN